MLPQYFQWQGNQNTLEYAKLFFYIPVVFAVISLISIYLFRKSLRTWYANQTLNVDSPSFKKIKIIFLSVGLFIWLFSYVSRVALLEVGDYFNKWEYLPLHLCRILVLATATALIFNKTHYVKYWVVPAFIGSSLALASPQISISTETYFQTINTNFPTLDLNKEKFSSIFPGLHWSYDSHFFWEFLITHLICLVLPIFLQIIQPSKHKLTTKILVKSILILFTYALFIFFLSWIIFTELNNHHVDTKTFIAWNPNWLYLGKVGLGELKTFGKWPYVLFSLTIIFFTLFWLVFFLKMLLEKFSFSIERDTNGKFKYIFEKQNWKNVLDKNHFNKQSFKIFNFNKLKK